MKFYVVFNGLRPGLYDNWDDARAQVEGFAGAIYKGYTSKAEATKAWRAASEKEDLEDLRRLVRGASVNQKSENRPSTDAPRKYPPEVDLSAWAVDASCQGNPGLMEYRGVEVATGKVIFKSPPYPKGTNNIGEFLAIVHAMALMTQKGEFHNIYSDSRTGMSWVRNRRVKTMLKPTAENARIFELLARAQTWLQTHTFPARILKWETEEWGEIPADYGRK